MDTNTTLAPATHGITSTLSQASLHEWAAIGLMGSFLLLLVLAFAVGRMSARPSRTDRTLIARALKDYESDQRSKLDPILAERIAVLIHDNEPRPRGGD